MHLQHSQTAELDPHVAVSEPWAVSDSEVAPPGVHVWPLGQGSGHMWALSVDEAEQLGRALLDGAAQARALFPGTG